ncbi:Bug family tripartite tricarboxylate transporter substrate binding protein [Salipiger abyssi]|uniref:Bug family tripartite tricarboxylate transporter substrate binding protein n=1 Tax=Salipiger abyssi TaxID=1250539 RepID=UPI001A8DA205|nr:tripartite tricarboxylate transporter substrate binding protein [Salipiger abyssi]MBN9888151.1 tripartite tricarboxylate transporter substrate binding protein [Salipiger abyssi]
MKRLIASVAAVATLLLPSLASADEWPSRPPTIIVPYSAGGSSDTMARAVAQFLSEKLGQQFIIENRGGAGGSIGASAAAKAEPDGYTFLFAPTGVAVINKMVYGNLDYDFEEAFVPVIRLNKSAMVFVANPDAEASTFAEFVAAARAEPGQLNVGIPGIGSTPHMLLAETARRLDLKVNVIPYKGGGPLSNDLVAGQLMYGVDGLQGYTSQLSSGTLKALAVGTEDRMSLFPDVPALNETGVEEFADFGTSGLQSIWAPAGTPDEIIAKMNGAINEYLDGEAGKKLLTSMAMDPVGGSPEDLTKAVDSLTALWGPVVEQLNIRKD